MRKKEMKQKLQEALSELEHHELHLMRRDTEVCNLRADVVSLKSALDFKNKEASRVLERTNTLLQHLFPNIDSFKEHIRSRGEDASRIRYAIYALTDSREGDFYKAADEVEDEFKKIQENKKLEEKLALDVKLKYWGIFTPGVPFGSYFDALQRYINMKFPKEKRVPDHQLVKECYDLGMRVEDTYNALRLRDKIFILER